MAPVYKIQWTRDNPPIQDEQSGGYVEQDPTIISTESRGSTPTKAIENALKGAGGVQEYEIEGFEVRVFEIDEDGDEIEVEA